MVTGLTRNIKREVVGRLFGAAEEIVEEVRKMCRNIFISVAEL